MADSAQWAGYTFSRRSKWRARKSPGSRGAERCDVVIALAHTGLEKNRARVKSKGRRARRELPATSSRARCRARRRDPRAHARGDPVRERRRRRRHAGRALRRGHRPRGPEAHARDPDEPVEAARPFAGYVAFGDSTATDEAFAQSLAPYAERTKTALDETVGTATGDLTTPGGRFADGPLWQLIHHAQLGRAAPTSRSPRCSRPTSASPPARCTCATSAALPVRELARHARDDGRRAEGRARAVCALPRPTSFEDGRPLAEPGMPSGTSTWRWA